MSIIDIPDAVEPLPAGVDPTGYMLVDNLITDAILQAQSMNHPPKTAALDAVRALYAAAVEWKALVDGGGQ